MSPLDGATTRGRRVLTSIAMLGTLLASVALLVIGSVAIGRAAYAEFVIVPPTGAPGRLVLAADPYPAQFLELSPGEPAYWAIAATLEDASRATLSLELRKEGTLVRHPRGLTLVAAECGEPWSDLDAVPRCASGARSIAIATPADDYAQSSPAFELAPLTAGSAEHLLLTLVLEDSPEARADQTLMGLSGRVGVGLTAVSIDDVPVVPRTPLHLPSTGLDRLPLIGTGAIALGLLGMGIALRLRRKDAPR